MNWPDDRARLEREYLGALLIFGEEPERRAWVGRDRFSTLFHREVMRAFMELWAKDGSIDLVRVKNHMLEWADTRLGDDLAAPLARLLESVPRVSDLPAMAERLRVERPESTVDRERPPACA